MKFKDLFEEKKDTTDTKKHDGHNELKHYALCFLVSFVLLFAYLKISLLRDGKNYQFETRNIPVSTIWAVHFYGNRMCTGS